MGELKPPKRVAETPSDVKGLYIRGEEAPKGQDPESKRPEADIEITLQGAFNCSEVSFSKSLGLKPDRGYVVMPKTDLGLPKPEFVVEGDTEGSWDELARTGFSTGLPEEKAAQQGVKGKGFAIVGELEMRSPYGSIKLGPLFVDLDGVRETKVSEDRIGNPAPFGSPVLAGKVPPPGVDSVLRYNLVDERIWWDRRGLVTGRYNIESNIEALSIRFREQLYERHTINFQEKRPWNLLELLQLAVANLPPREFNPDGSRIPSPQPRVIQFYPLDIESEYPTNVIWQGITAKAALQKLLDEYQLHLNLRYDGNVDVFYTDMEGSYDPLLELVDLLGDEYFGKSYNFKPPAAIVVGKPILEEVTISDWVPVCQWDGSTDDYPEGAIIPLEEALEKWGLSHEELVDGLVAWFDGKDGKAFSQLIGPFAEKRQKILKDQAYQWFRAEKWEDYVPIEEKRLKKLKGIYQKVPVDIRASWWEAKKEKDPAKGLWVNIVWGDAVDYLRKVDKDNLVIQFRQPMGVLVTDPKRIKDEELAKIAEQVLANTKKELALATDLQKLIAGLGGENLEDRKKALEQLRSVVGLLKEDISRVNLHECDILPPIIDLTFQYKKKERKDVRVNSTLVKFLRTGQRLGKQPYQVVTDFSDRYVFFAGNEFSHAPEVIPAEIQYIRAADWNNKAECDELAANLIRKRYAPADFTDLIDAEFAGFHPIPTSGRIVQVAWDSDAETATTKVKYGDYYYGIEGRPGNDWKEDRGGPVTKASYYWGQGVILD